MIKILKMIFQLYRKTTFEIDEALYSFFGT